MRGLRSLLTVCGGLLLVETFQPLRRGRWLTDSCALSAHSSCEITLEEVVFLELCQKGSPAALREARDLLRPVCHVRSGSAFDPFFEAFWKGFPRVSAKQKSAGTVRLSPAQRRALKRGKGNVNPSVRPSRRRPRQVLAVVEEEWVEANVTQTVGKFQLAAKLEDSVFWTAFSTQDQKDVLVMSAFLLLEAVNGRSSAAADLLRTTDNLHVGQKHVALLAMNGDEQLLASASKLYHLVGGGRLGAASPDTDYLLAHAERLPADALCLILLVLLKTSRADRRRLDQAERIAEIMTRKGQVQLLVVLDPLVQMLCGFRRTEAAKRILGEALSSLVLRDARVLNDDEKDDPFLLSTLGKLRGLALERAALRTELGHTDQVAIHLTPRLLASNELWMRVATALWRSAAGRLVAHFASFPSSQRTLEGWAALDALCSAAAVSAGCTAVGDLCRRLMQSADVEAVTHGVTMLTEGEAGGVASLETLLEKFGKRHTGISAVSSKSGLELPLEAELLLLQTPVRVYHAGLPNAEELLRRIVLRMLQTTPDLQVSERAEELSPIPMHVLERAQVEYSVRGKLCHAQLFSWRVGALLLGAHLFKLPSAASSASSTQIQVARSAAAAIRRFGARKGWYGYGSPFPEAVGSEYGSDTANCFIEIDLHGMPPEAAAVTLFLALHDYVHADLGFLTREDRKLGVGTGDGTSVATSDGVRHGMSNGMRLVVGKGLHSKQRPKRGEYPRVKGYALGVLEHDFGVPARVDRMNSGALIVEHEDLAQLDGTAMNVTNVEMLRKALYRNWRHMHS